MRGKDHAGIHTGRNDRNGRPRGTCRRTALADGAAACWKTAKARRQNWWATTHQAFFAFRVLAEAATRNEGLDGVHPDET